MICSPCKECPKKHYPKDICLKDCKVLQQLQDLQIAKSESSAYTAIDYGEESRFSIVLPLNGTTNSF